MFLSNNRPSNSLGEGLQVVQKVNHSVGKRCYEDNRPTLISNLGSIRTFNNANRESMRQIDLRGKKVLEQNPTIKKPRAQKIHLSQPRCDKELEERGIKTFEGSKNKSLKQYNIQRQLQSKTRVEGMQQMRNGIDLASFGDKSYKIPEHSTEFYKAGGLITGSSMRMKKGVTSHQMKIIPFSRPNYQQKVKIQEQQNDRQYLKDLDIWQQTILKEVNPPKQQKVEKSLAKAGTKDAKKPQKK